MQGLQRSPLIRDEGVGGSNPLTPTKFPEKFQELIKTPTRLAQLAEQLSEQFGLLAVTDTAIGEVRALSCRRCLQSNRGTA